MKNREIDQDIVGIAFLKDKKLLIVQSAKSARNNLYTLVGGGVEKGERILEAAIRECHEEVDNTLKINENDFEFLTSYQEPAASDPNLFIKMNVYLANKKIDGIVNCNPEIISYKWYQMGDSENVSSSIKEHFLPFAIKNKLMDSTYYEELVLNYLNDDSSDLEQLSQIENSQIIISVLKLLQNRGMVVKDKDIYYITEFGKSYINNKVKKKIIN